MNDLTLFEKGSWKVRTLIREGEPWFVSRDLCDALGISDVWNAVNRLPDGMKDTAIVSTLGGPQNASVINEAGLYKLAFTSRKPEAEAFTDWVASEVLPSIRKYGMYATPATVEAMLADPDTMIRTLTALKEERALRTQAEQQLQIAAPKVEFYDTVTASSDLMDMRTVALILGKKGMGRTGLFAMLRDKDILDDNNAPYQEFVDRGYFKRKETKGWWEGSEYHPSFKTFVTQKGLDWIRRISAAN
jgi:anti-repressor protein